MLISCSKQDIYQSSWEPNLFIQIIFEWNGHKLGFYYSEVTHQSAKQIQVSLYKTAAAQNSKCCGALHVRLQKHLIASIKKVAYVNKISFLWQQCLEAELPVNRGLETISTAWKITVVLIFTSFIYRSYLVLIISTLKIERASQNISRTTGEI